MSRADRHAEKKRTEWIESEAGMIAIEKREEDNREDIREKRAREHREERTSVIIGNREDKTDNI